MAGNIQRGVRGRQMGTHEPEWLGPEIDSTGDLPGRILSQLWFMKVCRFER